MMNVQSLPRNLSAQSDPLLSAQSDPLLSAQSFPLMSAQSVQPEVVEVMTE
jgi:hypothetical protein